MSDTEQPKPDLMLNEAIEFTDYYLKARSRPFQSPDVTKEDLLPPSQSPPTPVPSSGVQGDTGEGEAASGELRAAAPIERTQDNSWLDEIKGVGAHRPRWADVDCPQCGAGSCGPHPDVLVCRDCDDDWPCVVVLAVIEELDAVADGLCCGGTLRNRAAALACSRCSQCGARDRTLADDLCDSCDGVRARAARTEGEP